MKIYVPNYTNGNCAYIRDANTIRVYSSIPINNSTVQYIDYYINSHYIYVNGSTTFNNYQTIPTCLSNDTISTNIYYRNDMPDIMLMIFITLSIGIFIFRKMFRALIYGGRYA